MPLYSTIASQNPTTVEAFHDVSQTFWVEFWVIFLGNSKSYQKTFMKSKINFKRKLILWNTEILILFKNSRTNASLFNYSKPKPNKSGSLS